MQQGLPDMGAARINQGDVGKMLFPEFIAQPGCQFKTGGTAANDNDVMNSLSHE
jgi:hypothetical protein